MFDKPCTHNSQKFKPNPSITKKYYPGAHKDCKNIREIKRLKSDDAHILTCIVGFVTTIDKCPRHPNT